MMEESASRWSAGIPARMSAQREKSCESVDYKPAGWHSLQAKGRFWFEDYFDRYIRNAKHFENAVSYIENNPVRAGLCAFPGEWPFGSAWFRARSANASRG